MQDIGMALNTIMRDKNCSSVYALLLLCGEGGEKNELRKLQSKSEKKASRRLRNTGNF